MNSNIPKNDGQDQSNQNQSNQNQPRDEMPLFSKTYDFLAWLVPQTNHFQRSQRFAVTQRLLDAALNFMERLVDANNRRGPHRLAFLQEADAELDKVRFYLRLAHRWKWLNDRKYQYASTLVAELGRLLGGWQRLTRQQSS